jgi:transposase-like protein
MDQVEGVVGKIGTEGVGAVGVEAAPTEVSDRPVRRRYTIEYKVRILREAEGCREAGELGALLRREGLYSSHLSNWRRQRDRGELAGQGQAGRPPKPAGKLLGENKALRRENEQLRRRLKEAETIIEIQKKVSELLGTKPPEPPSDGSDS